MAFLHDMEVSDHLAECVQIDQDDMDGEFRRVAADLAYWTAQHAAAVEVSLRAKAEAKRVWARAWERERDALLDEREAGEKVTDRLIESRVLLAADVVAAEEEEIAAEGQRIRLHGVAQAIGAKKDALQSLGAKLRKEMEGEIWLRRRQHEEGADG